MRCVLKAIIVIYLGLSSGAIFAKPNADIASAFQEYSDAELVAISYSDYSQILKKSVFEAGLSDRHMAVAPSPGIGRRMVRGNKSSTRYEGNRLDFPSYKEPGNLEIVLGIRAEIEALPSAVPMREWTRNQQLAYWLNLYNITVITELAQLYPLQGLAGHLYGKGGLFERKLLKVAGIDLSLNDIHHEILIPNWQNPLVMYGLFHGYVGSANIRTEAYTAANVWKALEANAHEFINSNRGVRYDRSDIRVAELYKVNKALFPNWETDLKAHLRAYATTGYNGRIAQAKRVKATTSDYYIADLFQGVTYDLNSSASNPAALSQFGSVMSDFLLARSQSETASAIPDVVIDYVLKIAKKKVRQGASVRVEELEPAKPEPEKQNPEKQN